MNEWEILDWIEDDWETYRGLLARKDEARSKIADLLSILARYEEEREHRGLAWLLNVLAWEKAREIYSHPTLHTSPDLLPSPDMDADSLRQRLMGVISDIIGIIPIGSDQMGIIVDLRIEFRRIGDETDTDSDARRLD